MKTIKIRLQFSPDTQRNDRRIKLQTWANAMLKGNKINILEEKHLEQTSYIVVENTRIIAK